LDSYVNNSSYASEKKAWFPSAWTLFNVQGHQYAVPFYGGAYFIYYNKTMWKKLGLGAPPKTRDELVAYAQKGTSTSNKTWGYLAPTATSDYAFYYWFQYFHNSGQNFMDKTLSKNGFNNPTGVSVLQWISDFYNKHKVTPPPGSYTATTLVDLFKGGKALMMQEATNTLPVLQQSKLPFEFDFFMPPPGPGPKTPTTPASNTTFGNEGSMVIAKSSKYQDQAWEWIKYLTSQPVLGPFTEKMNFNPLRNDIHIYKNNPQAQKMVKITQGRVQGFQFQMSPHLRAASTDMWNNMETALGGKSASSAVAAAGAKVDSDLH
jgi:multiple sugar transport system substrate-binding protein